MKIKKVKKIGPFLALVLFSVCMIACEKEDDNTNSTAPADHTINEDGFMHKTGLNQPLTNCISCHGADLQGGTTGVSCYSCHGEKW